MEEMRKIEKLEGMEDDELFADSCRACLGSAGPDYRSLDVDSFKRSFETVSGLMIEQDEGFRKLCSLCANVLTQFQQFRAKCRASDATVKTYYAEKRKLLAIKKENIDADYPQMSYVEVELFEPFKSSDTDNQDDSMEAPNHSIKIESEETNENYDCGLCDEKDFQSIRDLSLHLDHHRDDPTCYKCLQSFGEWTTLLAHRFDHLSENQDNIVCHICLKKIQSIKKLQLHLRKYHQTKISCSHCKRVFAKQLYLKKHLKYAHKDDRPFKCITCPKRFKTSQQLRVHSQCHAAVKKYKCNECDFSCNFPGGIKSHISRRHVKNESIKCSDCDKEFKSKETYAEHMRVHKTAFICSQCGKKYHRTDTLRRHMMSHTGERPFACKHCPSRFKLLQQLKIHERSHTGDRPYKCQYCPSAFGTQGVLIKHTRIHTGERPFVCQVCGKGFTGGNNLKVHMKVHGEYLVAKKDTAMAEFSTSAE